VMKGSREDIKGKHNCCYRKTTRTARFLILFRKVEPECECPLVDYDDRIDQMGWLAENRFLKEAEWHCEQGYYKCDAPYECLPSISRLHTVHLPETLRVCKGYWYYYVEVTGTIKCRCGDPKTHMPWEC